MESSEKKEVIIRFSNFEECLQVFMGIRDRCCPDLYITEQLKTYDPNEQYIHVEYPSNKEEDHLPLVWRIKDWKTSVEKWRLQKQQQEESNKKASIEGEIRKQLLEKFGGVNTPATLAIVDSLIKLKNADIIKQIYGIDVSFEGL